MPKPLPAKQKDEIIKEEPQSINEFDAIEPPKQSNLISDKQRKRLYALCNKVHLSAQDMKDYLLNTHGIEHSADITKDIYKTVCLWVDPASESK